MKLNKIQIFPSYQDLKNLCYETDFISEGYGYVYIVEFENCVKIGISINPVNRIGLVRGIGKNYSGMQMNRIAISQRLKGYREIEKALHMQFNLNRINEGELFNITFEQALKALREKKDVSPQKNYLDLRRKTNPFLYVSNLNNRLSHYTKLIETSRKEQQIK